MNKTLSRLGRQFRGDSVRARSLRSSGFTLVRFTGASVLRLASNLILTRLLFPEAFGLMALVQVFIYGLQTFSDVGIRAMLIHHKRGGDRDFLDVLWTLQVLRGACLWIAACIIAFPISRIYDQPELLYMLPVIAFSLVIEGFKPTKEIVANRELKLERVVIWQLVSQFIELAVTVLFAVLLRSVWALALGLLVAAVIRVLMLRTFLPGENDKLSWDKAIVMETLKFGSFIFLSTVAAFFVNMGNRTVLGAYVDLATFGIFSIAVMIGNTAGQIPYQMARTVIAPLYRIKPPRESAENQANLFKARRLIACLQMAINIILALSGVWLIDVLYDTRYLAAGPMLTLIALRSLASVGLLGSQEALVGSGDSKRYFYLMFTSGIVTMLVLFASVPIYGVAAAIMSPLVVTVIVYPLRAWLIHRYKAWDPVGELGFMALGSSLAVAIGYLTWDDISLVLQM